MHVRTYYSQAQDFQPIQNSDNNVCFLGGVFLYFILFLSRSTRKWRNVFLLSLILGIPTAFIAFLPVEWKVLVPGLSLRDALLCVLSTLIQVYMYVYYTLLCVLSTLIQVYMYMYVYYTLLCVLSTLIQVYMYVRVLYTAVCVVHAHTGIHVRTCIIQCCVCCPHSYRYTCTYVYYTLLCVLSTLIQVYMYVRVLYSADYNGRTSDIFRVKIN